MACPSGLIYICTSTTTRPIRACHPRALLRESLSKYWRQNYVLSFMIASLTWIRRCWRISRAVVAASRMSRWLALLCVWMYLVLCSCFQPYTCPTLLLTTPVPIWVPSSIAGLLALILSMICCVACIATSYWCRKYKKLKVSKTSLKSKI